MWQQVSGPIVALDDTTSLATNFVAPTVQTQAEVLMMLTVTDDDGAQSSDSIVITIIPRGNAPVADAGVDQVATLGMLVQLDGSTSFDPDGDALTYQWSVQSAPPNSAVALSDLNSPTPTFVVDVPGEYQLALVVSDNVQSGNTDVVSIVAGTALDGVLVGDTALSPLDSPFVLTGTLQIPYGYSLTASSGIEILGQGNTIVVGGSLDLAGDEFQEIRLSNIHIRPASGPEAELFGIRLAYVHMTGGSLYGPSGGAIYGGLVLTDSVFVDLSDYIYLWYPKLASFIERNVFVRSGGISTGTLDVDVIVRNNVFEEQTTEFAVQNWASYAGSKTLVELNSFLTTNKIALKLPPQYSNVSLDGTNNYWNTSDATTIDGMIYDRNDDIEVISTISFNPFLPTPDGMTPAYP